MENINNTFSNDSLLFPVLREKGMGYIRDHAGQVWTDHNLHDPGITLLEVLCYAITELGYQIRRPIDEILTEQLESPAAFSENFPGPEKVLPNAPVTAADLVQYLLANVTNTSGSNSGYPVNVLLEEDTESAWKGLRLLTLYYDVAELSNYVRMELPNGNKPEEIYFFFNYHHEISASLLRGEIEKIELQDEQQVVLIRKEPIPGIPAFQPFFARLKITLRDNTTENNFIVWGRTSAVTSSNLAKTLLKNLESTDPLVNPVRVYINRIKAARQNLQESIWADNFFKCRNLGEDLSQIRYIPTQDIEVNASIEIAPSADPVKVTARILLALDRFFTPRIRFDSVRRASSEVDPVKVYEGPLAELGLYYAEETETDQRPEVIYVSDLMRVVHEVKDVVYIGDFSIGSYFYNQFKYIYGERNSITLSDRKRVKPILDKQKSSIVLTRGGIALSVDSNLVTAELDSMRLASAVREPMAATETGIVAYDAIEKSVYHSIQYDFPEAYNLGKVSLSSNMTSDALARVKQFRAYLFFFEQILANHYAQASNLAALMSVQPKEAKTRYFQPLYDVPGMHELVENIGDYEALLNATESSRVYISRRNRVLEHYLARYGESRDEYESLLAIFFGDASAEIALNDRIRFVRRYPDIISRRSQAFDYRHSPVNPDTWNSDNIGGYAELVCLKLGFASFKRRYLYFPVEYEQVRSFVEDSQGVYVFYRDGNGPPFFKAGNGSIDRKSFIESALKYGAFEAFYTVTATNGKYYYHLCIPDENDPLAVSATGYDTETDAYDAIAEVVRYINERLSMEGLFVLEHILLRPADKSGVYEPLKPFRLEDGTLTDPYSNVLTVIVPSGYRRKFDSTDPPDPLYRGFRLRDPEFVRFIQTTIKREAPAHLLVNVFFLDVNTANNEPPETPSLQNFEVKFKYWLESLSHSTLNLVENRNNLVRILNKIYE